MVGILTKPTHVRDHIVDLLVRQQIRKRRHNLREPTRWPAMHDHCLPVAVRLRSGPCTVRKVRKRVWPRKNRTRHGCTLPFAPVTRDAATLVDLLSIPRTRTFRVVERLCGKQQRATKKHDNPNDVYTRQSHQKPEEESKHSRFAHSVQVPGILQCRNYVANSSRLVSHSPSAFLQFNDQKRLSRAKITRPAHFQELPISTPVPKTKAPPSATCVAADMIGVSMYRCRIQVMTASSTRTTRIAIVIAAWNLGIRKGSVWPIPPRAVMTPQTNPRTQGWPRPVRLPSSDSASAKPMLIPAPSDTANPTRNASHEFRVARAAANTGASVDTEPSISPARPGCTICKTKSRRRALSSSSLTFGHSFSSVNSCARSSCVRSS